MPSDVMQMIDVDVELMAIDQSFVDTYRMFTKLWKGVSLHGVVMYHCVL